MVCVCGRNLQPINTNATHPPHTFRLFMQISHKFIKNPAVPPHPHTQVHTFDVGGHKSIRLPAGLPSTSGKLDNDNQNRGNESATHNGHAKQIAPCCCSSRSSCGERTDCIDSPKIIDSGECTGLAGARPRRLRLHCFAFQLRSSAVAVSVAVAVGSCAPGGFIIAPKCIVRKRALHHLYVMPHSHWHTYAVRLIHTHTHVYLDAHGAA